VNNSPIDAAASALAGYAAPEPSTEERTLNLIGALLHFRASINPESPDTQDIRTKIDSLILTNLNKL